MPGTPIRRTLPSWEEIHDVTDGIYWCQWCVSHSDMVHRTGLSEWKKVHWSERTVTRRGIRRFLSLCYESSMMTLGTPRWKMIWQRARWIRECESLLHVDVTSTTTQVVNEKSEVRFLLRDPAWRTDPDAKKAWAWANGPTGERRQR